MLKELDKLCTPSYVYFVISVISIAFLAFQNVGNSSTYCVGDFSCDVPSTIAVFVVKVLYVVFWTWILNLICKAGYKSISWFLVIFPFVLFFVLIGLLMLNQKSLVGL